MRYDAAIIGAGANGLTAAATLARAGLKVVMVERAPRAGGRLTNLEFHPGHFASPYADTVAEIPAAIARAFDLKLAPVLDMPAAIRASRDAALARAFAEAAQPAPRTFFSRLRAEWSGPGPEPWPGEYLAMQALATWPALRDRAAIGRALDPQLAGSALALLSLPTQEAESGGLGALGESFVRAALAAGAELRLGQEAAEVVIAQKRAAGVALADGSRVMAGAVISSLDLKQSLLSFFPWAALPPAMLEQARLFRMAGARARLLLALSRPLRREQLLVLPGDGQALRAVRHGAVPQMPDLMLDPVSHRDPALAPLGAATVTVTLGPVPYRLFDGGWTAEKRSGLAARALARIEKAIPGALASLKAVKIFTPPDMESSLNATTGDLDGGALAPDQMLALRPGPRTAVTGFYLGGRSTQAGALGTGAGGFAAAAALMADRTP